MRKCALAWSGFAAAAFFLAAACAWSAEKMPPAPTRYFNDYAHVTQGATAERLNQQLEQFEKDTSSQIVVAVFPKMESDSSLEDYVHRMLVAWKIGQQGKNNGALLAVFVQDRRMRIEVGYGLEGAIPDAIAKRIVSDEMAPHFRSGNYDAGLSAAVSALMSAARGEYKGTGTTVNEQRQGKDRRGIPIIFFLVGLLVFMSILSRAFRGSVYRRRGYSSWGALPTIWTGGGGGWGGGGGGGWSGGGGGGFSGGGGDSGGGGASGSW